MSRSVVFIKIKPSNVLNTAGALDRQAAAYHDWSARLRAVPVEGMPPDYEGYVVDTLQSAAATVASQGTTLGGKSRALEQRIEDLIRSEASGGLQFSSTALDAVGYYTGDGKVLGRSFDFEAWVQKRWPGGKTLTVGARLDAYVEYLEWRDGVAGGGAASAAWRVALSETRSMRTGLSIKYERSYARAVGLALARGGDGRVRPQYVRAWMDRLAIDAKIRARVPRIRKIPKWLRGGSKIPVVGAAFDGVIGYQQSQADHWYGRALTGANNAAGNVVLDVGTGGVYSIADLGLSITDATGVTDGRAPSSYVQVEADAQVMAALGQRQQLANQLAAIKAGNYGAWAKKQYGTMSEEDYVEMRLEAARPGRAG